MKSPFPGMDPYLEQYWRDVHHSLCTYARDALQPQLRPALLARVDERLVVESDSNEPRSIYPDVKIVQRRPDRSSPESDSAVGVAEPLIITVKNDPTYEGFIQILDPRTGGTLVTVIEFLSMSNKASEAGINQYRQKQKEAVEAGVSVVEIDLLRSGQWVLQMPEQAVPPQHRKPYRACVSRGWKSGELAFYRFPIKQRLPKLRIPLRKQDEDAVLDLQELIDRVYLNGGYDEIDYRIPPLPPLDEDTAQWARELVAKQGC